MDVKRSINTRIWLDSWFETLTPDEKLVWFYLLTNPTTNMLGIYEVSLKRISSDTGLKNGQIVTIMESFERVRKAFYWFGRVFLPNWLKNQSMNPNMYKSAQSLFKELPNELIDKLKENGFESFESLSKGLATLSKIESEIESEIEVESEREKLEFDEVWNLYDKKIGDKDKLITKWKKLTKDDRAKIFDHIPKYKLAQPDKQFRKNFETYLNNKSWNDELLFPLDGIEQPKKAGFILPTPTK